MLRRLFTMFILVAAVLASAAPVRPYTLQYADAQNKLRVKWQGHTINVALSTSLSASAANIKAGSDVIGAARRALAKWSEAADIEFVESISDEQSISAAGGSGDGVSLITVASTPENVAPFIGAASDMSGRTRVFYTKTGRITEADIVLNPYQQFSSDGTPGTYDLEATFMHEIGHLLGLEHSSTVGATMQPRQGRNGIYSLPAWTPRTLSEDDRAGVRAIYGERAEDAKARGAIGGAITSHTGAAVFGANVWAEEIRTGRVVASNITLADGSYRLEGLLPGQYQLHVETLDGPVPVGEIASPRGAYAGLANSPTPAAATEDLGEAKVSAGRTTIRNAQLSDNPIRINPTLIGFNGQLSTLAVPLSPGRTYTIYVGGDDITPEQIPEAGISISSPYISVNPASIVGQKFGTGISVMSFEVTVSEAAPPGDYSVRLQSKTGEIAYIVGGLTIDGPDGMANPWQSRTLLSSAARAVESDFIIGKLLVETFT